MNLQKFTIKAQETVNGAQTLAIANKNQQIEPVHILKTMFTEDPETLQFLFGKLGVNGKRVEDAAEASIKSLSKVDGGQIYISQALSVSAVNAEKIMKDMGDEFITNEHLLTGIVFNT